MTKHKLKEKIQTDFVTHRQKAFFNLDKLTIEECDQLRPSSFKSSPRSEPRDTSNF